MNGAYVLSSTASSTCYLVRGGCAWRMMPLEYPPWSTVYDYYRQWRRGRDGTWEAIHTALRETALGEQVRQAAGRESTPSAAVLDSQSVKTTEPGTLWVEGLLVSRRLASMDLRRSRGASAICWWTLWWTLKVWHSRSKSQRLTCANRQAPVNS